LAWEILQGRFYLKDRKILCFQKLENEDAAFAGNPRSNRKRTCTICTFINFGLYKEEAKHSFIYLTLQILDIILYIMY